MRSALPIALLASSAVAYALGPAPAPPASGGRAGGASSEKLGAPLEPRKDAAEQKQRGVALGLFAEDIGFSYAPLLAEIVALGATHVALIVPIYQTDARSSDVALHTRFSPTLETLADTIRVARRDRLEVTVFPILRLVNARPGEWRGTLAPAKPDEWFRRYGDLLGDLAAVAATTGASRLVVGSELSTLDGDLERWRPLLQKIRALFNGRLIYSANWDHYRQASLLDLCDEEGVVAYFNLRADAKAPSDELALANRWRQLKSEIETWRRGRRQSFLFTEVGYRSRAGSTAAPWEESAGGPVDLDEQRRAFAAFRQVWAGTPYLEGIYLWNWYGYGGASSAGYTPRGKPAEAEVKRLLNDL